MLRLTNEQYIELFKNRVKYHTYYILQEILNTEGLTRKDKKKYINYFNNSTNLYIKYYQDCLDNELFNGDVDYNINDIVDNDIINYTKVITPDHVDYHRIKLLYEDGITDISEYKFECNCKFTYIENEHNGYYLVRY